MTELPTDSAAPADGHAESLDNPGPGEVWETPTAETPPEPLAAEEQEPDVFPRSYVEELRQENGRYRQQLRERDAQLEAHRRAEAERMVGARLLDASLLWAYGSKPSDLVGEDGRLSAEKVDAAVASLLSEHPQFRSPMNPAAPAGLVGWDASNPLADAREKVTAQGAFRRALGRDG